MEYSQIFLYGWAANVFMFLVNLLIAINVIKSTDITTISKEHRVLNELKVEVDKYYPNRGYETLISYFLPFAAFYKVLWRLIEMMMFFQKNRDARIFDFMVYRYEKDIFTAKKNSNS